MRQAPVGVEQRKVFLVRLHRQDQAFLRHREELGLELAQQHVRPFDQRGDFVEQGRVVDRRGIELGRGVPQLARDLAVAGVEARDHRALRFELARVVVGVLQHHRVHRRLEAMAARLAAGRQTERGHRHDLGAVQRDQAMRRAHELHAGPAVGELVGHDLRDRQLG